MKTVRVIRASLIVTLHLIGVSSGLAQTFKGILLESRSTGKGYSLCGSCTAPASISSSVWLTPKDESGEQVIISGTIYGSDGVTPDSGIVLFLYQTDAGGYYHRPTENVFHPKLFGWLMTGRDGRYEIHTIRPAPEILAAEEPAHIHAHVFGKGMPEHFLHEFWFENDAHIAAADKERLGKLGSFSPVVTLIRGADSVARGMRNIRIKPAAEWKYEQE